MGLIRRAGQLILVGHLYQVTIAVIFIVSSTIRPSSADDRDYGIHDVNWDAASRSYLLHVPPNPTGHALPLVIALHGAGENADRFAAETGFAAPADVQDMMVAFPNGTPNGQGGRTFNAHFCCGEAVTRQIDDVGFIGAVIDDVARHYPLDRARVFATGMSNGGMMTHILAAVRPEWFAAIAPVAGAIGGMTRSGQTYLIPMPDRPVSVLIIHGMQDRLVLYEGGSSPALSFPNHWKLSVADALSFWAAADHCPNAAEIRAFADGALQSTSYAGCAASSTVRLWAIRNGDHEWPGAIFPADDGSHSTAAEILSFFAGVSRREAAGSDR